MDCSLASANFQSNVLFTVEDLVVGFLIADPDFTRPTFNAYALSSQRTGRYPQEEGRKFLSLFTHIM